MAAPLPGTRGTRKWWRNWHRSYPEIAAQLFPNATEEDIQRIREEGVVFRFAMPAPPPLASVLRGHQDAVRPWSRAIFERGARAAAAARWPALKQEIIAGALKPSRVSYLIETYGFDALDQFE